MKYISALMGAVLLFAGGGLTIAHANNGGDGVSPAVGKVVFVLGQAELQTEDGSISPVFMGMDIPEKSRLVVRDGSQVGWRMQDGATGQVRENSVFDIQAYHIDTANPENTEIRLELVEGEVSTRTGGSKESKHRYRLNTPIAAIGIRGTEFTVSTTREQSLVSLQSGEIVMSGFNAGCLRAAVGPCGGNSAEVLSEAQKGLALVFQEGQFKPQFVPVTKMKRIRSANKAADADEDQADGQTSAADTNATTEANTSGSQPSKTDNTSSSGTESNSGEAQQTSTTTQPATGSNTAGNSSASAATSTSSTMTVGSKSASTTNTASSGSAGAASMPEVVTVDSSKTPASVSPTPAASVAAPAVVAAPVAVAAAPMVVATPVEVGEAATVAAVSKSAASEPVKLADSVVSGMAEATKAAQLTKVSSSPDALAVAPNETLPTLPVAGPKDATVADEVIATLPTQPVTVPVLDTKPVVKWGRWNPAAGTGATPLSLQVNSEYELVASNRDYAITRETGYATPLPSAGGTFHLKPGTSEAYVNRGGEYVPANVENGKLDITVANSESATFSTGFDLKSTVYNGSVVATGTISKDGIMKDNRQIRDTVIQGAVAGTDKSIDSAAYTFYKWIDQDKYSVGGIDWVK